MGFGKNKKWLTLVELIITITILAILAVVAFLSFQSFARDSRNTVRINDINNMRSVLEYVKVESWYYPPTTRPFQVTFSWALLWNQGTFWKKTLTWVKRLSKVPVDPLTENEYTYSLVGDRQEYELGFALEWDDLINRSDLIFDSVEAAGTDELFTSIVWSYNWKISVTTIWTTDYILAIPSIITVSPDYVDIQDIYTEKTLAFKWFANLPHSYSWALSTESILDLSAKVDEMVVFSWDIDELKKEKERMAFYKRLSDFYNTSPLRFAQEYETFWSVYADEFNPTQNFADAACALSREILHIDCENYDIDWNLITWDEEATASWALAFSWTSDYAGQWTIWSVFSWWGVTFSQWLQTWTHERNSMWMPWDLSKAIWTKWKLFTQWKKPAQYLGWYDINWDGNENILYGFWWKLFMWDVETSWNVWESKVYDIKTILWVESVLSSGVKSIIVALTDDWVIGVINWDTGVLEWTSQKVTGPVKSVKLSWPSLKYKTFDINNDGIKEYHFKQWYDKYHSYEFFEQSWKVVGETLWASEWYGNYNAWSDWYQPSQFSVWKIWWNYVVWTKWSHTFAFYSSDVDSSQSGINKFKMPAFWKWLVWWNTWNWWSSSIGYFYDFDGDGNDEYVSQITQETNNNKQSRIFVWGLDSWSVMTQYMSLSYPLNYDSGGAVIAYGNYTKPIPLKNVSNPSDSYIITYWKDPDDLSTSRWMMLKYNWNWSTLYKPTSAQNEAFNYDIVYDKFDSSYTISWLYNNWAKDYVVLHKSWKFYFYTFSWVDTFLTPSSLEITGWFFWSTFFKWGRDIKSEQNDDSGVFLDSVDTDGNWVKEFVVTNWWYFRFYEVLDTWVVLKRSFGPYTWIPWVIQWGMSEDLQNVYAITYDLSSNIINYYKTDSWSWDYTFTKMTNDNFYSGWEVRDILISKLWNGDDEYNKLMIQWKWMYDAREAKPIVQPTNLWTDYFYSFDMDHDGKNEIFKSWQAYTFNGPWNHTLKYPQQAWSGDINGDWVDDAMWWYCAASAAYPRNLYFTIRSGLDGSYVTPDLDWGNGNGWCSGGTIHSTVSEDMNDDGRDEIWAWVAARWTRILSLSWWVLTQWNQVYGNSSWYTTIAYDFDWDGRKEIMRWMDNLNVFSWDEDNVSQLTSLIDIAWNVKSTAWVSWGTPSVFRNNGNSYVVFRWVDWQVSLKSWQWWVVTDHFNNYYLNAKKYANSDEVFSDNFVPVPTADVLLWDLLWDWTTQVLVWGWDGYIYIIGLDGNIIKAYDIGASIKRIVFGDVDEDNILDILVSAEDWYIYQIASSIVNPPSIIRDGQSVWYDIRYQTRTDFASLHFPKSNEATGYFIQLYNKTKKSFVFDWIDVWNTWSICVTSNDVTEPWCVQADRYFRLAPGSIYRWKVQSYNDEIASPISVSNWFYIQE